jgi:SAM-dependent methyltransferase
MPMTSACRICAQPTRHVFDLHGSRHGMDVPVYRCARCRAYWSDGGPVNYDDVDLSGYYLPRAEAIRARYERVFSHLERRIAIGSFMDIGAGMGFSLEVALRRGWSARGIEPNRALAVHAQRRGLDVVNAYLADDTPGSYDVVLIDNVLEHVPDPMAFLRSASRLLAPKALMVVAIPPLDWLRRWLGTSAYVRDHVRQPQLNVFGEADEHVNMLGRRAMRRLADAVGLDLLADRFHHSPLFDNAVFRALGLDDGYYFVKPR